MYYKFSTNTSDSIFTNYNDNCDATINYNDYSNIIDNVYEFIRTDDGEWQIRTKSKYKRKNDITSKIIYTEFSPEVEERLKEYIENNYDRYDIKEYGDYIYSVIQEKAYEFAYEIIEQSKDEYIIPNEDKIVEEIIEQIDFESIYELVEAILKSPITTEDRLADLGMSMSDFL